MITETDSEGVSDFQRNLKCWREFLRARRTLIIWQRLELKELVRHNSIGLDQACVIYAGELFLLYALSFENPKQAQLSVSEELVKLYANAIQTRNPPEQIEPFQLFGGYLSGLIQEKVAITTPALRELVSNLDSLMQKRQLSRALKLRLSRKAAIYKMELSKIQSSLEKAKAALLAIVEEVDEDISPDSWQIYDAACLLKDQISTELITIIVSAWKRLLKKFVDYYSYAPDIQESFFFWGDSRGGLEFLDAVSHYRMMECFDIGEFPETRKSVEEYLGIELMGSILEKRPIAYNLWIASRSDLLISRANQDLIQTALSFIVADQHRDGWMYPPPYPHERVKPEPNTFFTAVGAFVIFKLGRSKELCEKGGLAINWLAKWQRESGAWATYHTKWRRTRSPKGRLGKPKATTKLVDDLLTTIFVVNAIRQSGLPGYEHTVKKAEEWILKQQKPEGLWTVQADDEESSELSDVFISTLVLEYFCRITPAKRQRAAVSADNKIPTTVSALRGKIDFGIITIRQDEFEATLQQFPMHGEVIGQQYYAINRLQLNDTEYYLSAIMRCVAPGEGEAQSAAHDLIHDLRPKWILLVGIGGGIPDDSFTLGDVVAATQFYDFSVEARLEGRQPEFDIGEGQIHPRIARLLTFLPAKKEELKGWSESISIPRPPVDLTDEANYYGDPEWTKKVKETLLWHFSSSDGPRHPLFTTAKFASSNSLIKDTNLIKVWHETARHISVVEMELAGVYLAARNIDGQYPVLAIRGISDIIGFERVREWTAYACQSAAAFTRALLGTRPIEPIARKKSGK
ncbi:MAG TPA: hypothetical protein VLX61_08340 [Anaerolineales bacterium]|nr:hypothetical protein [Anaerolineales bacterium]